MWVESDKDTKKLKILRKKLFSFYFQKKTLEPTESIK